MTKDHTVRLEREVRVRSPMEHWDVTVVIALVYLLEMSISPLIFSADLFSQSRPRMYVCMYVCIYYVCMYVYIMYVCKTETLDSHSHRHE